MAESLASAFYNQIISADDPGAFLESLIGRTEEDWLDFKGFSKNTSLAQQAKDIRKIWAENLSAFANTAGGLLIWGIRAQHDKAKHVSVASELALFPEPTVLKTTLQNLHLEATDPPVAGVQIHCYPAPSGNGTEGFVVCYIPESEYKPHCAKLGDKAFFMRFGDKTKVPATSVIRSLFYPKLNCRLAVDIRGVRLQDGTPLFTLNVINAGPATADDLLITCAVSIPNQAPPLNDITFHNIDDKEFVYIDLLWEPAAHTETHLLTDSGAGLRSKHPIHPGMVWIVGTCRPHLSYIPEKIMFECNVFLRGMGPQECTLYFKYFDLLSNDPIRKQVQCVPANYP